MDQITLALFQDSNLKMPRNLKQLLVDILHLDNQEGRQLRDASKAWFYQAKTRVYERILAFKAQSL